MEQEFISFEISHPGRDLDLVISMDGQRIWQSADAAVHKISLPVPNSEGAHCVEIELSGKQPHHTKISPEGSILEDCVIKINEITCDDIKIDQLVYGQAIYHHDFNGSQPPVNDNFYGTMGCNGKVRLEFTTPIYLWLLDNM